MTIYHSIVINEHDVSHHSTTDVVKAENTEYYYRGKNYNTSSFGNINGDVYIVVYEHPKYKEERDKTIAEKVTMPDCYEKYIDTLTKIKTEGDKKVKE